MEPLAIIGFRKMFPHLANIISYHHVNWTSEGVEYYELYLGSNICLRWRYANHLDWTLERLEKLENGGYLK